MKYLKNNVRRCKKLLHCRGKNTNYLNEFKYMRGTIHNLNLRCLNKQNDVYEINLIAKDFVKRMLSNYIYFDKWTIDYPNDFQLFLSLREKGRCLITPLPGYSTHGETQWLTPIIDWSKV